MAIGEVVVDVAANMDKFQRDVEGGMSKSQSAMRNVGDKMNTVGRSMTRNISLPLAVAGGAIIKTAADFDKSMNAVKAVSGATGSEFDKMRQQAVDLGGSTAFSASEAADGMKYLGQAGFDTNEIMAAMPGTLDLAAASATDLGTTADIMSNIITGFGESADQSSRYADVLSAAAAKSNTDLTQLGDAMKYVAPVAASAGYGMEETAAAVGQLSNAGIQGSMAGTTLRGAISRLLDPTAAAGKRMDELGIAATDSSGKLKPMDNIVQQLADSGATTADYMKIFGQRAGPGMAALVKQGSGSLSKLEEDLNGAGGTAKKMADTQMAGAAGAMEELSGAAETLAIAIADSGLIDWFTKGVEGATKLVRSLSQLDPALLKTGTAFAGIVIAAGPLLAVTGSMVRNITTVSAAVSTFAGKLRGVSSATAPATTALGNVGTAATTTGTQVSTGATTAATGINKMSKAARVAGGAAGLGVLTAGMVSAKTQGTSFANVMTGTVGGALTGFAVGGPIGALIGGVAGGGLTALAGAFNKTESASKKTMDAIKKTNTQSAQAMYDNLTASLNQVTGAYSDTSRAAVTSELFDKNGPKGWVQDMNEAGIATRTLTSAIMGQPGAVKQVEGAMRGYSSELASNNAQIDSNKAKIEQISNSWGDQYEKQQKIKALKLDNSDLEKRNTKIREVTDAYEKQFGKAEKAVENTRAMSDANNTLAQRLGVSKQRAEEFKNALPKTMRTKFESNALQMMDDFKGVTKVLSQMKDPKLSDIKIALKAANLPVTEKNIRRVRRELENVGKTKPDMSPAVAAIQKGIDKAKQSTDKGSREARRNIESVGQAKPNMAPAINAIQKGIGKAQQSTRKGGQQAKRNVENPLKNAQPNFGPFTAKTSKQLSNTAKVARNKGQQIKKNAERPPSRADAKMGKFVSGVVKDMQKAARSATKGGGNVKKNAEKPVKGARADLGKFQSGVSKGASNAARSASRGGSNVAKGLKSGTSKARADLSPFMSSLSRSIKSATGRAGSGGKQVKGNLERGSAGANANLSSFQSSLSRGIGSAKSTASSGGASVGSSLASGLQGAISSAAGSVASAAASMVSRAIGAAKAAAKSKSPSRETYQLGLDIDAGLRLGIQAGSKQVSRQGWLLMRNLLRQMSRGQDIAKYMGRASDAIGKQYEKAIDKAGKAQDKSEKKIEKRYQPGKNADKARKKLLAKREKAAIKASKTREKNANKAAKRVRDRQNRELKAAQKYFTAIQNQYNRHTAKLKELRDARSSMISDVQSSFVGELDLTITPGGSFENVASVVKAQAQKARQFSSLAKQAIKAGVPKGLVQTILGYGSEQGIPLFKSLISGNKTQIKDLSADYAAISSYGKQAGTALGNEFYTTGIAAQEGLIKGLLNRQGIKNASSRLARQLTKEVKKALGIRSPSKLMEVQVGIPTGQGIMVGAEKAVGQGVGRLSSRVSEVQPITGRRYAATPVATAQPVPVSSGPAPTNITQVFTGPTTSGGRLNELDWTIRYATRSRSQRWDGVAR